MTKKIPDRTYALDPNGDVFVIHDWGMDKVTDFVIPTGYEWGPTEDDSFRYLYPKSEPTNEDRARAIIRQRLNAIVFNGGDLTRDKLADVLAEALAVNDLIAPEVTKVYLCKRNSDLTEGRGGMIIFDQKATYEEAVRRVKNQGVQGFGDGEVWELEVSDGRESRNTKVYETRWKDGHKPWYAPGFPRVWDGETR